MKRASTLFTEEQHGLVTQAVAEAESQTAAELVPVVVTESGRYDRTEDMFGLVCGIVAMSVVWTFFQREDPAAAGWDGLPLSIPFAWLVVVLVVAFMAGATIATHVGWLRRLFTPRSVMAREVEKRAGQVFHDQRIHHTEAATGLLIYVSLFERYAVVRGDRAVVEALGEAAIEEACRQLRLDLRRGDVTTALCAAIKELGRQLGTVLPREEQPVNQLADVLVTMD